MTTTRTPPQGSHPSEAPPATPDGGVPGRGTLGVTGALSASAVFVVVVVILVVVASWHATQGTTGVGGWGLIDTILGRADSRTADVVTGSRLPRLLAGLIVGVALGAAGATFQSLARNALASPDTLAINAGAYAAVTAAAAFGLTLPIVGNTLIAFAGALGAAGIVLILGGGGAASTTRLILAGAALALALNAVAGALLLLFQEETTGLYAWGNGSLSQTGLGGVRAMGPVLLVSLVGLLLLSRRMDLLALGDDTAAVLGIRVRTTRVVGTVIAVLMCACAVNIAGPIGFVGLAAPAAVRLTARFVPAVNRHLVLIPLAGLVGAIIVLLADALLRQAIGAEVALVVPTGVTTTLLGAFVLIVLARGLRDSGPTRQPATARVGVGHTRLRLALVVLSCVALAAGAYVIGVLAGDPWLRVGDVTNWLSDNAVLSVPAVLEDNVPRATAAVLGGAALALAGTVIQAVCRNPLAEPSILGITGGAGLGAAVMSTVAVGYASTGSIALAAGVGSLIAFAIVYATSWRGGLESDRLVLIGIGVAAGAAALTSYLLVRNNRWDTPTIFTFLSGSTYGRDWPNLVPVAVALLIALPLAWIMHRELDLVAIDDDTPRLAGIRLERSRFVVLAVAALVTSTAVSAVGVVGFVGLVAPHAARALVGSRHIRVVPVAVLLGAALLAVADTIGRTVISPNEIPAGLVVAAIGAPYFLYLLYRSRA